METNKLIAIIVVAVVVIAGVGVAWFMMNSNDSDGVKIDAALEVYGNANNDDKIDQADIDLINEIIAGDKLFDDYPLADADNSGNVTEADVEQVEKILAADSKNKVTVYHINHFDHGTYVTETKYPITSAIASGAATSMLLFKYLGISEEFKGLSWVNPPDGVMFSEFSHLAGKDQNLGTSASNISLEKASNLVTSEDVSAAITSDNRTYLTNEKQLEEIKIDVIRVQPNAVESDEYMSTVLMIAFLFDTDGKGYMKKCADLMDWYEDFLTDLDVKLSKVKNKVSAVSSSASSSTTHYVSTASSDFTAVLTTAGATFPLTDKDASAASIPYTNGKDDWLDSYDIDYVMCIRTSTTAFSWYGGTALTDGASTLTTYMNNWKTLKCYMDTENVYIINGDMPVFLRIAYCAQIFYKDIFGDDYAYNLHVDFVKKFFGWEEDMIKGKPFVVTMGDLGLP